jgi:drug/metabolite transporter (DMT)-like permease
MGWLLVALGSPSLRVEVSSALLLLTPIGALVLAAAVLAQMPSALQVFGCTLILGSAYLITAGRSGGGPNQADTVRYSVDGAPERPGSTT